MRARSASTAGNGRSMAPEAPVFLITGASSGIGAATARHAAQAGYRLVLAARPHDKLAKLARQLPHAIAGKTDVTQWSEQPALARASLDAFGRLYVSFANARL